MEWEGGKLSNRATMVSACVPEALSSWPKETRVRVGWMAATLLSSSFYLLMVWLVVVLLLALNHWRIATANVVVAAALSLHPTREWPGFARVGQLLYEAFDARHNLNDELKGQFEDSPLIFCLHPHGVIPLQTMMFCALCEQHLARPSVAVASVLLRLPFFRTALGWLGGRPANFKELKRGLAARRNLCITPGGLAEMFETKRGRHAVVWKNRRGLVKLALQTQARLVPVYVFNNDFFDIHAKSSLLSRFSRRLRVSLLLYFGQFGLPIPFKPRFPVLFAFAPPLPSTPNSEAFDDQVAALHRRYEASLQDLFNRFKAQAGTPNAKLEIL